MYTKVYSNPDIYNLYIPLPENPLKNLNCYVIKTAERSLIIDTGFNRPECLAAMQEGIKELGLKPETTDIFITHLHSDHTGLVSLLINDKTAVYMSAIDHEYLEASIIGNRWAEFEQYYISEGFPESEIAALRITNPARAFEPAGFFDAVRLNDGDKINVGRYEFTCILTPGHTPGHMCLYYEKEGLMFLGDHVLFDITPNICWWKDFDNSLLTYLNSLKKIRAYNIKTALPAHRTKSMDVYERIDQILAHHDARLNDTLSVIRAKEGMHAYDIAGYMKWSMRGKSWDEFPMHQKWFAVGETIAHLDYLLAEGKIRREEKDGIKYYYNNKSGEKTGC